MENKTVLIVFFVIILGLAIFLFFQAKVDQNVNTEFPVNQEETEDLIPAEEGYPDQVLDGIITELSLEGENPIIKINARLSKIVAGAGEEIKTVKVPSDVEVASYDMDTEEQKSLSLEEIEVGDNVSIAVEESTFEDISKESFTAFKIVKFLGGEQAE